MTTNNSNQYNMGAVILDKINPDRVSKPILFVMAVGCAISIIGLFPAVLLKNMAIFYTGLSLIGVGLIFLVTLVITVIVLLSIEASYHVFEKDE